MFGITKSLTSMPWFAGFAQFTESWSSLYNPRPLLKSILLIFDVLCRQLIDDTTLMLYTSPEPTGIIPPHSTVEVPLVITPQALEEIDAVAEFSIFGSTEPPQVS